MLIAALSLATAAQAEGFYVEGGSLARRYDLTVPGASGTSGSAKGRTVSGALRLGYELDPHWAVEAGYMNHGSPGYGYRLGSQDGHLTSHGRSWLLGGRATMPLSERFAFVARLGLAANHSSLSGTGDAASRTVSGSTTALYGGLGLETTLAPGWHLGLAWEHLGMNRDKKNGASGSVVNGLSTTLRYTF